MRCLNLFALLLVAGLVNVGGSGSMAWGQTKHLESPQMGIVVNVPDGWKVAPNEVNPTAVWQNGAAKLVLLYFGKQWLYEVMNPEKVAAHFAPALDNAKIVDDEKAVVNELVGAKATGTGMLHGKPVQFKCVIVGDRDNQAPHAGGDRGGFGRGNETAVQTNRLRPGQRARQKRQIGSNPRPDDLTLVRHDAGAGAFFAEPNLCLL